MLADVPSIYPAELKGERLRLRELELADLDAVWTWGSQAIFFRYLPVSPPTYKEEEQWLQALVDVAHSDPRPEYSLGIELLATSELVGAIRLGIEDRRSRSASLGYGVHPAHQGQGIGGEAAGLMVRFGFERLRLHRIWATHHPDNVASGRIMARLGFVEEGRRREERLYDGVFADSIVRSILEHEWRAAHRVGNG